MFFSKDGGTLNWILQAINNRGSKGILYEELNGYIGKLQSVWDNS